MTQEEKQLVLIDLCTRFPYKIKVKVSEVSYPIEFDVQMLAEIKNNNWYEYPIPYLRPMSSITVEEKEELLIYVLDNKEDCKQFKINDEGAIESIDNNIFQWVYFDSDTTSRYIDWLNKNHFDYRGLIGRGLAIKAPKGMYK